MTDIKVPKRACPGCGEVVDGLAETGSVDAADDLMFAVCFYCAKALVVGPAPTYTLRLLTLADLKPLDPDTLQVIEDTQRAVRKSVAERRAGGKA